MDLLKSIRQVFEYGALKKDNSGRDVIYVDTSGDHGKVYTMNIHGFGDEDDPDNYECVDTPKGEEMFRTLLKRLYNEVLHKDQLALFYGR